MKIASFDVDAQKGFTPLCPDELPVNGGDQIATLLNEMANRASIRIGSKDAHNQQAVWIVDKHDQMLQPLAYPNADLTWLSHCIAGTKGFELLDNLPSPMDYDYFVWKGVEADVHPYGACYHDLKEKLSTGVIEYLRQQAVDTVLIGGLALDYCVKTTAIQLKKANFKVFILLEATRAIAEESKIKAINEMTTLGIVMCDDIAALDRELQARGNNNE